MMQNFRTFKEKAPACELMQWLQQEGIQCNVQEVKPIFDPTYVGAIISTDYEVQINATDFERANQLLVSYYQNWSDLIPKDYYLFNFSDSELLEIVSQPDQWGDLDYALAQNILAQRGQSLSQAELQQLRQNRIESLKQPERDANNLISLGFGMSLLGGIMGSLIGWYISNATKLLPDGTKVYAYTLSDRKKGVTILKTGVIFTVIYTVFYLYRSYFKYNY